MGISQCSYSFSLVAMSVIYLLGILDGREIPAPLLMLVDLLGLRVFYCFSSKCQWDFHLPLLQQLCYFAWLLEAGGFPLLPPGKMDCIRDAKRVGRVSCLSPNGSPSPPTCLQYQQRELSWVLVPPISLLCTSSYWRPGKRA